MTDSFQRSLTVLFAIGLEAYLRLEVVDPHLPAPYPGDGTQDISKSRITTRTGLSPSLTCRSRQLQLVILEEKEIQNTTSPPLLPVGIQFAVCRVQSLLLAASRLISFPAGTKMFQFPAFPILTDHACAYEVAFGHSRLNGCLHLTGTFCSLPHPSSALPAKSST